MGNVVKLQHVSVPMPAGGLDEAREFYGQRIGLEEKPVPSVLNPNEIVWFRLGDGDHELHVFTEAAGVRSPGQHLCIEVDDIDSWRQSLVANGVDIEETDAIVNRPRFFVRDPFDNRIEFTQVLGDYS